MSDDKVTSLPKEKSPKDSIVNKMREAAAKESQTKLEAQFKKMVDAKKIYRNERLAWELALEEAEDAKKEISEIVKDL